MDDETTINVKGVRKSSWNAATQAASLRKEHYGPWLSDAIDLRLRYDAGQVKPPGQDGEDAMTVDQRTARIAALAELAKGLAAVKAAGSRPNGISALSHGLAEVFADAPRRAPLIRGQESGGLGQDVAAKVITLHATDSGS